MSALFVCPSCALQFPAPRTAAARPRCPRCGTAVGDDAPDVAAGPSAGAGPSLEAGDSAESVYWCAACGDAFPLDQVYDDGGGKVICHGCYEVRAAAAVLAPAAAGTGGMSAIAGPAAAKAAGDPDDFGGQTPSRHVAPKASSRSMPWTITVGMLGVAVAATVVFLVARPDKTAESSEQTAAAVPSPGAPETNLQRVNRLWREARTRSEQRDRSEAARLYEQMFEVIDRDPAISGNRSLMADLAPARQEWALSNDAAGLPPLPGTTKPNPGATKHGNPAGNAPEAPAAAAGADGEGRGANESQGAAQAEAPGRTAPAHDPASAEHSADRSETETKRTASARKPARGAARPVKKARTAANKRSPSSAGGADPDPGLRGQVAAILDEAETSAKRGDKAGALARYTHAIRAAGDRSLIRDAAIRKRLAAALAARAALIGQLRGGKGMGKLTLDALMADGARALEAGKWEAALDALRDARTLVEERTKIPAERVADPHYVPALHGMAVAYLKLHLNPKAGDLFDDKAPLGKASLRTANRELVWNRAVIDMIQKYKVMRAVKGLKEYLERNPDEVDEGMMNLFGTAIYAGYQQFDDAKKPPPLLVAATALYERRERQLELGRDGEKRWGVDWIPADEFDRKMEQTREIEASVQRLRNEDLARARQSLAVAKRGRAVRSGRRVKYIVDEQEVKSAKNGVNRVLSEIKEERAKIPQRSWLARYEPIMPALAPQTALASAASPRAGKVGTTAGDEPESLVGPERATPSEPLDPSPAVADATPPGAAAPEVVVSVPPARRVQRYAAAFAVDRFRLITAAAPLGDAATVFLEDSQGGAMQARVIAKNEALALLEVDPASVNGGMRYLNLSEDFAGGTIRCTGLPSPSLFGPVIETIEGRSGRPVADAAAWSVSLPRHPRLAGAPLLDAASNGLVGVVVAERDDPATKLPAVSVEGIRAFLTEHDALPKAESGNPDPTAVYQVTIEE